MEVKVLEERENVFFKRKDVKLELVHHGSPTPSKQEVEKIIAEKFKTTPDHVLIDYIFGKTGIGESIVKAKIYKERVKKPEEKKPKEEPKPEERPAEEAKPKEEKKPEEKTTEETKQETEEEKPVEEEAKHEEKKEEGEKVETQTS